MQRFLFASAEDADATTLATECLNQIGEVPADANLGFVYATDRVAEELRDILVHLERRAPIVHWVGTVGMGICIRGREIYDRPALALMIGAFPTDSFRVLPSLRPDTGQLPEVIQRWWEDQEYCFALLHGDPTDPETPDLLERLVERQGSSFFNGGLTSSNGANPQLASAVVSSSLSGVVFNNQVPVLTDHTQGCSPVGPVHEITQARQNIAITLDHRPALEVMKSDIGEVLARDLAKIGGYIFAALPIGVDPERNLVAVGDLLDDKRQIMFCRRDGNTAREDLDRMLARLRKRIGERPIRGAIYISCLGRGRHQFGDNSEELKLIQQILGDAPLVGFFANGEIYNGRLYGYTGVLTLFL
jgi:small ligand-binding sensory domain FIST